MQQRLGDNVGQLLDPNHASMLKAGAAGGQPQGYFFFSRTQLLSCTTSLHL